MDQRGSAEIKQLICSQIWNRKGQATKINMDQEELGKIVHIDKKVLNSDWNGLEGGGLDWSQL